MYRNIVNVATGILLPFSATYVCESSFSERVSVKTKASNKLDYEADMQFALSSTKPRIKLLVSQSSYILHINACENKLCCRLLICFDLCIIKN